MATPKQQRLILAGVAVAVLLGAGVLATATLGDTATYFYAPSDLAAQPQPAGKSIRLGGLVKAGSVQRSTDGLTLHFAVVDHGAETPVSYRGIVPDLFQENQGVVATGSFDAKGQFVAQELLARHDENYMPPEVARSLKKQVDATQPGHPAT